MRKQATYSPEHIYEILKEFNFMEANRYLDYDNPIWQRASSVLPLMSKQYVWVYVTSNRHQVSEKIHGFVKSKKIKTVKNNSIWPFKTSTNLPVINNTIHLPIDQWNKLNLC